MNWRIKKECQFPISNLGVLEEARFFGLESLMEKLDTLVEVGARPFCFFSDRDGKDKRDFVVVEYRGSVVYDS